MFAFIRYTIYLLVILLCLFALQKLNVDVKGDFWTAVDKLKVFGNSIKNAPPKTNNAIVDDILKKDLIGGLKGTTTIKSFASDTPRVIPQKGMISITGILEYTNAERVKYGLQPFKMNSKLSASAVTKVDDMFAAQYFEHTAPSGKTAADLVRAQGYDFQSVGENLALGEFGTDQKLVQAWMNSPLHRKNILNPKFTELGLAVAKGDFKGDTQWIAVQHFGKPTPNCPTVPATLKENVENEKTALEMEEKELKRMVDEIESDPNQNKGKEYLDTYNARVATYNTRLAALRDLIKEYNLKVDQYNTCLAL